MRQNQLSHKLLKYYKNLLSYICKEMNEEMT